VSDGRDFLVDAIALVQQFGDPPRRFVAHAGSFSPSASAVASSSNTAALRCNVSYFS
jgi:hypothetical protein